MKRILTHEQLGTMAAISAAALLAGFLAAAALADEKQPPDRPAIIYYQTTYDNGDVRDLQEAPDTEKGIRMVVRIARHENPRPGSRVYSTSDYPLTVMGAGRVYRTRLRWDGKAWTATEAESEKRLAGQPAAQSRQASTTLTTSSAAGDKPAADSAEAKRIAGVLAALEIKLRDEDLAVAQAAAEAAKADSATTKTAAIKALTEARARRDAIAAMVANYRKQLAELTGEATPPSAGKPVEAEPLALDGGAVGVKEPVEQKGLPPYRMQVFRVPDGQGERTYTVTMQHAEGGPFGQFRYVAYADTNGDGEPDRQIGVSEPARAERAGGWTKWRFTTDEPRVFVGNTWANPDTSIHCRRSPRKGWNWHGEGTDVFVSGAPGVGRHDGRWTWAAWPWMGNIRVHCSVPYEPPSKPEVRFIDPE